MSAVDQLHSSRLLLLVIIIIIVCRLRGLWLTCGPRLTCACSMLVDSSDACRLVRSLEGILLLLDVHISRLLTLSLCCFVHDSCDSTAFAHDILGGQLFRNKVTRAQWNLNNNNAVEGAMRALLASRWSDSIRQALTDLITL